MRFYQYKRFYLAVLLVFSFARFSEASTKVDPVFAHLSDAAHSSILPQGNFLTLTGGEAAAEVILKVKNPQDIPAVIELIKQSGGAPRTAIQDLLTARIPLSAIDSIASSEQVLYIEAAKKLKKTMNVARTITGVDKVQDGTGTNGTPYKGKDVIVGLVDSGIDCTHADFKDVNGNSRILYYWDQNMPGTGVAEIPGSNGIEYSAKDMTPQNGQPAKCKESSDPFGHGTHVSGIAAGSDSKYTGVAPEANIIMVQFGGEAGEDPFSSSVLDAVNYILQKAKKLNKPVSINISLGTQEGAHDNTSLFEQGLNALLMDGTNEKAGAAVVVSAGNEGIPPPTNQRICSGFCTGHHAPVSVQNTQGQAFEFAVSFSDTILSGAFPVVDIWLNPASTCTIQVEGFRNINAQKATVDVTPDINMTVRAAAGNPPVLASDTNVTAILDFTEADNLNNHKKHAVLFFKSTKKPNPYVYTFDLIFRGNCTGDAWAVSSSLDVDFISFVSKTVGRTNVHSTVRGEPYVYAAADSQKTVTIPGTASEVITVGSFMSQAKWQALDGEHDQTALTGSVPGGISTFSSVGPTADGRLKPEIAAPGEPIMSSLSSDIVAGGIKHGNDVKGDATHFKLEGTSMAAPHITGMVALMLQKNSTLTHSQIKDFLKKGAKKDAFTGPTENNTWGAGKLDAVATMNAITQFTPAPGGNASSSGDGGCALSPQAANSSVGIFMVLFAVAGILFYRSRISKSTR